LKHGFDRLEGDDPAPVSFGAKRCTELANVRAHIDYKVNLAILDEIDQVTNSASAQVNDSKTLIEGPDHAIHFYIPFLLFSICALRAIVAKQGKSGDSAGKERRRQTLPRWPLPGGFA
jgi:hypothetical protein